MDTPSLVSNQATGEPVAWRYLTPTGWHATTDVGKALRVNEHHVVEPLGVLSKSQVNGSAPVALLLFCPKCHAQHIDAPEEFKPAGECTCAFSQDECETCEANRESYHECWTNPPHKSHLCHACGNIWRPADVETTGVASIDTKGKADTWDCTVPTAGSAPAGRRPFAFCRVEDVMNNDSMLAQVGAKRGDKLYLLEEIKSGTSSDAARETINTSAALLEDLGLFTKANELRTLLLSASPASPAAIDPMVIARLKESLREKSRTVLTATCWRADLIALLAASVGEDKS